MIVEIFKLGTRPNIILGYFYYRRSAKGGAKQKFMASVEWAVNAEFDRLGFAVNLNDLGELDEFPLNDGWAWRTISNGSGTAAKLAACWHYRHLCLITDFSPNFGFLFKSHWWLIHDVRAALGFKSRTKRLFYSLLLLANRRFVTVSNFTASEVTRLRCGNTILQVFPNGVSDQYIAAKPNGKTDIDIIAVGQFDRRKSHLLLIDAISRLIPDYPKLKVVFVGQPGNALPQVVHAIQSRGLEDFITIHSELDDEAVLQLYRRSRVSAHCSVYEGFGISVWEGLAVGHSVVASDIPAHREIAQSNVHFFRSGDVASLERRLKEAIETDCIIKPGAEVRSWAETCSNFWEAFEC